MTVVARGLKLGLMLYLDSKTTRSLYTLLRQLVYYIAGSTAW